MRGGHKRQKNPRPFFCPGLFAFLCVRSPNECSVVPLHSLRYGAGDKSVDTLAAASARACNSAFRPSGSVRLTQS